MTKRNITADFEAWEQTDNLWLIKIDGSNGGTFVKPNGERVTMNWGEYLIDPNIPLVKETVLTKTVGYSDSAGNFMSTEAYAAQEKELLSKAREDDDSDYNPSFENLDDEYAYKKFKQTWIAQQEKETIHTPVTFSKIHEVARDVNPYVKAERKVLGDPKNTLFTYLKLQHLKDILVEEYGGVYTISDLHNFEFVKIDDKYLSIYIRETEPFVKGKIPERMRLTREDAVAQFNHTEFNFRKALRDGLRVRKAKLANPEEVVTALAQIKTNAVYVRDYSRLNEKSREKLGYVITGCSRLLGELTELQKLDKQEKL